MVDVGQIFAGDFYSPNSVGGILAPSDKRVWGFFHLPSHLQPLNSRSLPIKPFFFFRFDLSSQQKWVAQAEKVRQILHLHFPLSVSSYLHLRQRLNLESINSNVFSSIGGKVKPLKAAKKEKKELDEDELAFREKQKAGKILSSFFGADNS